MAPLGKVAIDGMRHYVLVMNRRGFLITTGAVAVARVVPVAVKPPARRILTLVYDKALGGMRAVERLVR